MAAHIERAQRARTAVSATEVARHNDAKVDARFRGPHPGVKRDGNARQGSRVAKLGQVLSYPVRLVRTTNR